MRQLANGRNNDQALINHYLHCLEDLTMAENGKTAARAGKIPLIACLTLFGLYFLNDIIGKFNISYHLGWPQLGNVAEFLLLSAASSLLIIAAMKQEAAEKPTDNQQTMEVSQ